MTPLGAKLVPHAREIVSRLEIAEIAMKNAAEGAATLRLGALETTAGTRLPPLLAALSRRFPQAEISLVTAVSSELVRHVWNRELDAAFVVGDIDPSRFITADAFDETLVEVRCAGRPCADLHLGLGNGCSYRAAARSWLDATGRSDVPTRQYGSLDTILACVSAGLGFAVAPQSAVERYSRIDDLYLRPLDAPFSISNTRLIWRRDHEKGTVLAALHGLL